MLGSLGFVLMYPSFGRRLVSFTFLGGGLVGVLTILSKALSVR